MTPTGRRARSRWAVVAALLALAALVRVSSMFYGSLSGEDATVALIAKHILSGENFPVFFYRQTYMGTLNGIHMVPALALFGPSVLLVRLNAVAWSLLFPLGLYVLGRRVFDEPTARVALALAALPPFLLTYWSTVAEPHLETNVFGVWLLLLALTALTARSEPARTRALAVFGFLGGLALWTSLKVVGVLAPALLMLLLRDPRPLVGRGGALLAGGFLLGTTPAWLFYVVHGDHAGGTPGSVGYVLRVGVDLSPTRLGEFWLEVVQGLLGTYYWRPDTPLRWWTLASNCAIYLAAVALALRQLTRAGRGTPRGARAWGLALLLLTLGASLGAVYLSSHAGTLTHETARYALPAYIPLLLSAAALVVGAGRRSRAVGAALLAFLLLFAAWTHVRFLWPLSPVMRARESTAWAGRNAVLARLAARPVDALYVDDTLGALVWAFLLDRPTVSAMNADVYVPHAVAADAAARIAVLAGPYTRETAADLAAAGATWTPTSIFGWWLFEDVRVPARGLRAVARSGWRVAGDPTAPAAVVDGHLATAWPPVRASGPLDPLVVDLGREVTFTRVVFWPSLPTSDVFPLRVSGSADGTRWETLGVVPAVARWPTFAAAGRPVFRPRNGWLEVAMTPRPRRYLRVEPSDSVGSAPWGVSELQIYEPAPGTPAPVDTDRLVARLRALDLDRILADPVTSARVARATQGAVSTLVANGVVDNHGAAPPQWLAAPIRVGARDGLLVPGEEAPELRQRLESVGARYEVETLGDHALVRILAPLPSSEPCRLPARRAASREPAARTDEPARFTLEATLAAEALVSGLRLSHATADTRLPAVQVSVSRDGQAWQPATGARAVPEWGWAGRTLFSASDQLLEVVIEPAAARHLRVIVTTRAAEVRVLCVRGAAVASRARS